jgi:hypothetical protein
MADVYHAPTCRRFYTLIGRPGFDSSQDRIMCAQSRMTKWRNVPALHDIGQTDYQYFDDRSSGTGKGVRLQTPVLKLMKINAANRF